ncbi:glycosyl transferase group 1 [Halothece sp. PCC 7418]|uniref:glycosyltransferase n=1 Tax=Halothece sp. (strain PCC 7418) TaxID=65093 RepID=UPI0002A085BA|nr:glycosyltransferase [Halothece sp. PCC 7418]AFZ44912.1 glycosyl transferase group 1 [Halothece sp. PCC 7418]
MKILLINSADIKGGAAKVGYHLGQGLRDRAHEVTYLVGKKFSEEEWIQAIPKRSPGKTKKLSQRVIHRLGVNNLGLTHGFPFQLTQSFIEQFDLIHIHDLPGFNLVGFPWLTRLKPTVWTLHTLNPFTGNCLYPYDCDRWQSSCGQCPQFGQWPLTWLHRDASGLNLFAKRWIYRLSDLQIICVSEWLSIQAKQSILQQSSIQTILNPVDTNLYRPLPDQAELRKKLKIPQQAHILLFSVASKTIDTRKGLDIILEALPKLETANLFLIPLGITDQSDEIEAKLAPYNHLPFQSVADPHELNQLLNVADLIWHPSRADTSSLVILEAFAAAVPAIAAQVGGVTEIVTHGETGYLISPNDPDTLAQQTDDFFALPLEKRLKMKEAARDRAETRFSLERFLDEHESLYQQILSKN